MFYVVFVNNIKNKNIRIGMYLIYFVLIFILKLSYDKKKLGWLFEFIYLKCRLNIVFLYKFLCFFEERIIGDFFGRFYGLVVFVLFCGKCKLGSGCFFVRILLV